MEDNDGFDLDGVIVDVCSGVIALLLSLSVNLGGGGGGVVKGGLEDLLVWGLGVVRLIKGDFEDDNDEFEGERARVDGGGVFLEGVMEMTRVLGGGDMISFFKG